MPPIDARRRVLDASVVKDAEGCPMTHVTVHLDPGYGYDNVSADDFERVTARHAELYQEALRAKYPEIDWTVKVGASEGNSIDHWSTDEEREQAEELLDSIGVAGVDPDWQETLDRAVREVTRV